MAQSPLHRIGHAAPADLSRCLATYQRGVRRVGLVPLEADASPLKLDFAAADFHFQPRELDRTVEDKRRREDGTETVEVLPAPTITVARGWDVKHGPTPKSDAGLRDVPIPATLAELLRARVERTGRSSGDDLIFGRSNTLPFTDSHMRKRAHKAWDAEDARRRELELELEPLERVGFQDGRHCFRSYIGDIPEISEVRGDAYHGHANTTMRKRYTHAFQVRLARDAMRFDAYLTGHATGKIVPIDAERLSA